MERKVNRSSPVIYKGA